MPTLWNNDDGYVSSYLKAYPGCCITGDAGYHDEDGYLFIMGRTDDIINVAGHRLSTGGMEDVSASHPDVAECAVVGVADASKGEVPIGFVVLKSGSESRTESIPPEWRRRVRERIGPIAFFRNALVVDRLPKTRPGKFLRGTMKSIADGTEYKTPATIENSEVLNELAGALNRAGLPAV